MCSVIYIAIDIIANGPLAISMILQTLTSPCNLSVYTSKRTLFL